MSRRGLVALATVALAAAPLAHAAGRAADEVCTSHVTPAKAQPIDVQTLFAPAPDKPAGLEVLIARIGADGKPVLACVSTEEAARRFLSAPQAPRRAEEK